MSTSQIFSLNMDQTRRVVEGVITNTHSDLYSELVVPHPMSYYCTHEKTFSNFESAIEAIDVTLQNAVARVTSFTRAEGLVFW